MTSGNAGQVPSRVYGASLHRGLFRDDFDEDTIWKSSTPQQMNGSIASETSQHWGIGSGGGRSLWTAAWRAGRRCRHSRTGLGRRRLSPFRGGLLALGASIHRVVGELVGCLVLVAQRVADLESIELCDAAPRFFPEWA